ncbi:MAG: hypothetical protein M3N53_03015 [Actinomycetota bacterium]|nr:hypothetical protein [Actinomycetota bacterium]
MTAREVIADGFAAGAIAAVVSGAPSTAVAVATRSDVLEPTLAAGSILLPHEERKTRLVLAAFAVHMLLSLGWGIIISALLRGRASAVRGVLAGTGIGVFDLLVIGRRWPRIRDLPFAPQLADHVAFGLTVGVVLRRRHRARRETSPRRSATSG